MSIIACMMVGMPAITMTLPSLKPGARMVALWISSAPSGMRAMRSRASFRSCSLQRSLKRATTSGWWSMPTPKAFATLSAVMSSWVGPMPPVVKT